MKKIIQFMMPGFALCGFLLVSAAAAQEPAIRDQVAGDTGYLVNWRKGTLTVFGSSEVEYPETGSAAEWQLKAALEARDDLLKNFVSAMGGLRIDGFRYARDVIMDDPDAGRPLYRWFDDFQETSVSYGEQSVDMIKELPFFGPRGFLHLLVDAGADTGHFPGFPGYVFSRGFTGLVIDARGMEKTPSAEPRVWEPESHLLVYSAELMDPEYYRRWGSVQFTDDPYYSDYRDRVGEFPFRTAAVPDEQLLETDIALSTEDVRVLLQERETRRMLEQGRVIIILDKGLKPGGQG